METAMGAVIMLITTIVMHGPTPSVTQTATPTSALTCAAAKMQLPERVEVKVDRVVTVYKSVDCIPVK